MQYMKYVLILFMLVCVPLPAYAADKTVQPIETQEQAVTLRFVPIFSDDEYNYYLDTTTIKLTAHPYKNEQLVDVWLKLEHNAGALYSDSTVYILQHYYMRRGVAEQQLLSEVIINSDESSSSEQRANYSEANWEGLIPDTSEELCYQAVMNYVDKRFNVDTGKKKKKFLGIF